MPGASSMKSVVIWAQTNEPASVSIAYWKAGETEAEAYRSPAVLTQQSNACVAKIQLTEGLQPGERYHYHVLVNGAKETVHFREAYKANTAIPMSFQVKPRWRFIPADEAPHSIFDFKIAAGSCNYVNEQGYDREGGKPYGSNHHIFESIYEKSPDLMLWLGDNVYYRENDFESRDGMIHRWTHDRSIPELRGLLANTHHFATWDDHDYGPNDIGSSYPLKAEAKEVFDLFWANPSSGLPETNGIFTYFNWGDANVYMLDNRTHLSTAVGNPSVFGKPKPMLGNEQVDWLINHLIWAQSQMADDSKSYPARFNLICLGNQALADTGNPHGYRNFPQEWHYLIDRIVEEGIDGVIFLSGDVHYGEVSKIEYIGGGEPGTPGKAGIQGEPYIMHEITSSSLTAGSWAGEETNPARLDIFDQPDIDRVGQQNFVTLDFKGPLSDRRMEIRYYDSDGKLLNRKIGGSEDEVTKASILYAKDLKAPRPKNTQ